MITGAQILAARTMLRLPARKLAQVSELSNQLILQAERSDTSVLTEQQAKAVWRAIEAAGVIFVEENGEGPGVMLRDER